MPNETMSGHSKWSKVKHQKEVTDAAKSAAFTKASHAITQAVREGRGITDPSQNVKLRLAIDQARSMNMPKNTIERAIERAKSTSSNLEPFMYEGFGPGGIAIIVEGVTDNRARVSASVKHLFDTHGGTLAGPGAVRYLFERVVGEKLIYRPLARLEVSGEVATQALELINQLRNAGDVTDVATNL